MSTTEAAPEAGLEPEEQARAFWYGVLSRLFYVPPDRAMLESLSNLTVEASEAEDSAFLRALNELGRAAGTADPEALREEFESLFVGVGRAPVSPYTSGYAMSHAPDRFLLELRNRLGELGLARLERIFEAEDHASAVCDTMRWHIEQRRPLEEQREFFEVYVAPGLAPFCSAIKVSPLASFYGYVADVGAAFVVLERDAFDMHLAT